MSATATREKRSTVTATATTNNNNGDNGSGEPAADGPELLENCGVCKSRLRAEREPQLLPCLHTMCKTCLSAEPAEASPEPGKIISRHCPSRLQCTRPRPVRPQGDPRPSLVPASIPGP